MTLSWTSGRGFPELFHCDPFHLAYKSELMQNPRHLPATRCPLQDHELVERPGKGWTPWKEGTGEADIDKVWWGAARVLHFPKLNRALQARRQAGGATAY